MRTAIATSRLGSSEILIDGRAGEREGRLSVHTNGRISMWSLFFVLVECGDAALTGASPHREWVRLNAQSLFMNSTRRGAVLPLSPPIVDYTCCTATLAGSTTAQKMFARHNPRLSDIFNSKLEFLVLTSSHFFVEHVANLGPLAQKNHFLESRGVVRPRPCPPTQGNIFKKAQHETRQHVD